MANFITTDTGWFLRMDFNIFSEAADFIIFGIEFHILTENLDLALRT